MEPEDLARAVVDAVTRGFDPRDPSSYAKWDAELAAVEEQIRSAPSPDSDLLASVAAERIRIAYETGRDHEVVDQTSRFMQEFPLTVGSFANVAESRSRTLHRQGLHEQELSEGLQLVEKLDPTGPDFLYLISGLARRHPDSLPTDEHLWGKLQRSVKALKRTTGFETLPTPEGGATQFASVVQRVEDELRRINQRLTREFLSRSSDDP